jgi:hypothetical protein
MARYWGPNITIDGSWYKSPGAAGAKLPAAVTAPGVAKNSVIESYEYQTQEVLRAIENQSTIGRLLIALINGSGRTLRIVPVAVDEFATIKARPVSCIVTRCGKVTTDSVIWFEPTAWAGAATAIVDPGNHMEPDDVLFHEMFHSLRQMMGLFRPTVLPDAFRFIEEYYAVLFTNMYVSEVGRSTSRRYGHSLPFVPLSTSGGATAGTALDFYFRHDTEVDKLIGEMPNLCKPLGGIASTLPWNPIQIAMNRHIFSIP